MRTYDLSQPLNQEVSFWPYYPPFEVKYIKRKAEHGVNAQYIQTSNHMGTHLDAPRRDESRLAADHGHLALLGEDREARRQLADDAVLPLLERNGIDFRRLELDAVHRHRLGFLDHAGRMEQRLGRNAADVQADAAELGPAIHQRDRKAEVGGTEGGRVAARAGADHQ